MRRRSLLSGLSLRPGPICPDCGARYVADATTRRRRVPIVLLALTALLLLFVARIQGPAWLLPAFAGLAVVWVFVAYAVSQLRYVPHSSDPRGRAGAPEAARRAGHYSGTVLDGRWWKRYRGGGMFARGTGEFWLDDVAFNFRRYLTKVPMAIRYEDMEGVATGTWHAGQWAGGRQILKIQWRKGLLRLTSGFVVGRRERDMERTCRELLDRMGKTGAPKGAGDSRRGCAPKEGKRS